VHCKACEEQQKEWDLWRQMQKERRERWRKWKEEEEAEQRKWVEEELPTWVQEELRRERWRKWAEDGEKDEELREWVEEEERRERQRKWEQERQREREQREQEERDEAYRKQAKIYQEQLEEHRRKKREQEILDQERQDALMQEHQRMIAIAEHQRLVRQKQRYDALDDVLKCEWRTDRVWKMKTDERQDAWVKKFESVEARRQVTNRHRGRTYKCLKDVEKAMRSGETSVSEEYIRLKKEFMQLTMEMIKLGCDARQKSRLCRSSDLCMKHNMITLDGEMFLQPREGGYIKIFKMEVPISDITRWYNSV
jgi:hypothetical protein